MRPRLRFRIWRLGLELKRRRRRARARWHGLRSAVAYRLERLEELLGRARRRIAPPIEAAPIIIGAPFAAWRIAHVDDVGKASTHLALADRLDELAFGAGVVLGSDLELSVTAPDPGFGGDYAIHPSSRLLLLEGRVEALR